MRDLSWLCFAVLGLSIISNVCGEAVVVCYYGSWATYRQGAGRFDTSDIDPWLCTHVVYSFVGLNADGTINILDPFLDLPDNWGRDNFRKFNDLRKINPDLKTILAIGGYNEGSATYSKVMNNPHLRKIFVENATATVLKHGFDGFDLDWEYPNRRDTVYREADIKAFTTVLRELKAAFKPHGLLLMAAVSSVAYMAKWSYDVPAISEHLDLISIMAYDMSGGWNTLTGHNAPLHLGMGDENVIRENGFTVEMAIEYWLTQGAPPEKLLLGLPLFARTFSLMDSMKTYPRSPVNGHGLAGRYTGENGMMGYNEVCDLLRTGKWTMKYDELAKVPYAFNNRYWISYDDAASLKIKIDYGKKHNLAGVMVWSIETDDFHGTCHQQKFPLMRAINAALNRNLPSNGEISITVPSSVPPPVTKKPIAIAKLCTREEYIRDPNDCGVFYYCHKVNKIFGVHKFKCPPGLYFDEVINVCNHSNLVKCNAE